jgi:RIO-like serine/threonine protein kinase
MPLGIHRHVVRTVRYQDRLYHLKELPRRYALREWQFLRHLKEEGVPVVDVVGVVTLRDDVDGQPARRVPHHAAPRVLGPVPPALPAPRAPRAA